MMSGLSRKTSLRRDEQSHRESRDTQLEPASKAQRLLRWLITVPHSSKSEKQQRLPITRNYQVWSSEKSVFFLGGRFRFTKGTPIIAFTAGAAILAGVLFCIFEASWGWHHISPAAVILFLYCWLITLSSLIRAAASDPGVVPRNIHLTDDPYHIPEEYFNSITLPGKDAAHSVEIKYCTTCRNWRMPRTFHCSKCDQCISIHDHHCKWINNCVGERNYRYFYNFLLFGSISSCYLTTVSFYHVFKEKSLKDLGLTDALKHTPMSFFNGLYGLLTLLYPLLLVCYHTYLISTQQTTREFLRSVHTFDGPYSWNNIFKNILSSLCRARGHSLVSARGKYEDTDHRFRRFTTSSEFSKT